MDMSQRIDDLIFISERLVHLLRAENVALINKDNNAIAELLDEKDALCRAYEQRALVVSKLRDELDEETVEKERLEIANDLGHEIHELIEENAMMLRAGIEANNMVLDLFAEAIKQATPGAGTYSADGDLSFGSQKAPKDTAISYDETL